MSSKYTCVTLSTQICCLWRDMTQLRQRLTQIWPRLFHGERRRVVLHCPTHLLLRRIFLRSSSKWYNSGHFKRLRYPSIGMFSNNWKRIAKGVPYCQGVPLRLERAFDEFCCSKWKKKKSQRGLGHGGPNKPNPIHIMAKRKQGVWHSISPVFPICCEMQIWSNNFPLQPSLSLHQRLEQIFSTLESKAHFFIQFVTSISLEEALQHKWNEILHRNICEYFIQNYILNFYSSKFK